MNRDMRRLMKKAVEAENRKWPDSLVVMPYEDWPEHAKQIHGAMQAKVIEVWRSRDFLVQVAVENGFERMSVCKTKVGSDAHFLDGISWDDLQRLKSECGRKDKWAVEIYPAETNTVNVANLRHLWFLPSKPDFGW